MDTRNADKRRKIASTVRSFRTIHRVLGSFLFIVFVIVSVTGLLLGWKKNSYGYIHPDSAVGVSTDVQNWLPLDSLQSLAFIAMKKTHGIDIDLTLDRIDARPGKGMVKFIFENHYHAVQVDGTTGEILQLTRRNSDMFENIHDGSILDKWFGTSGEVIKLIYTSIIGISLLLFSITGFWLWFGPKVMRRFK